MKSKSLKILLRFVFGIFLFISNIHVLFGQALDSIPWSSSHKLKWSDFRGEPPKNSSSYKWVVHKRAACCNSILCNPLSKDQLPNYAVFIFFRPGCSWVTDTLWVEGLWHEQLHFDISELYARKIRKGIETFRKNKVTSNERYKTMIEQFYEEKSKTDSLYDEQSNHGSDSKGQAFWIKKIQTEMSKLEKYGSDVYYKK